jgi:hypothetical protein
MLIIVALAQAGTWNVCASTEARATGNAGWSVVDWRDTDGGDDVQRGTWRASAAWGQVFQPSRDGDLCAADGVGGATQRWTTGLIAVDGLPGPASCHARVWADASTDARASAWVAPARMAAGATATSVTRADAGNTASISVDGGGGARFSSEWAWQVPGAAADVRGTISVDASAAYNGASVQVPGWAQVEVWEGVATGWVRRGDQWVEVSGTAPIDISFGAVTASRGTTCAQGVATGASRAEAGEGTAGGSGVRVEIDAVRSASAPDARPDGGPAFDPCGC